ncbi:RNA-binding protein [soil metagenome]
MNIYVGSLPHQTTEQELQDLFTPFGKIASIVMMADPMTGQNRGFAFVDMVVQMEAESAIKQLNHKPFKGRELVVNLARPKEDRRGGQRRR